MNNKKGCFWESGGGGAPTQDSFWLDQGFWWAPATQPPGALKPIQNWASWGAPDYGGIYFWELDDTEGVIVAHISLNPLYDGGDINAGIYWTVNDISHSNPHEFDLALCFIGDGESLIFAPVYNRMSDLDAANDTLYITRLDITPEVQGGSMNNQDLLGLMFRRDSDSASGLSRILGIKLNYGITS